MVNVEYPRTFDEMRESIKRRDLMEKAVTVNRIRGVVVVGIDELCKEMSEISRTLPVKSDFKGFEFVVDRNSSVSDVLQAWKEQAYKPYLEKKGDVESMAEIMVDTNKYTRIEETCRSYQDAAIVEVLLAKHPEKAKELSMLQLLNAFEKSTKRNADAVGAALIENAVRYTKGEETFPPTLANMVTLDEHKDQLVFALGVGVNSNKLNDRIKESELEMLNNLTERDLRRPDSIIAGGLRIADKHKDEGDFGKKFTTEIKRRLSEGNIFDPR